MDTSRRSLLARLIPLAVSMLAALAASAPVPARHAAAQGSVVGPWDAWVGSYRNRARDGGAAAIASAVDAGIGAMGPVMERIARRRILASNPPFQTLRIERSGAGLTVGVEQWTWGHLPTVSTPSGVA